MTGEEKQKAINALKISAPIMAMTQEEFNDYIQTLNKIMDWLEQEPCEDAISRQAVLDGIDTYINKAQSTGTQDDFYSFAELVVKELPPVTPKQKTGHCKDCKYFEYNSMAKISGVPIIVAHEICNKWGNGCKSKEDGYCFLYEPRERSDKE